MSQYLPYNGFKWLNQNKTDRFDVKSIGENSSDRYILEVDLEYPDNLHELHNEYPSALEELKMNHYILLLGIKLVKIYRILKFKQSYWLNRQKKKYCKYFWKRFF